jgi:hypothetical protein
MAYLYGASVQGIQEFIFATNKLQEIVGASEIVKSLEDDIKEYQPDTILVNAAGNIKLIFKSKDKVEKMVNEFPKKIMQKAYGITISQAVVEFSDNNPTTHIPKLEERLKIQRNRPTIPLDLSLNIMKLNSRTAKPLIDKDNDKATKQKKDAYAKWFKLKQNEDPTIKELKDISALSNDKNKIAVIHADGNGLGTLIPKLKDKLSSFSTSLDKATKKAFEEAKIDGMKIREVILGGDDLTVICDADSALEFTKRFLENFETETSKIEELNQLTNKLTACAGIAYCNEKYPFHYAVNLAEELCAQTKKDAKKIDEDLAPSSLMFHNIQSSNFQSWDKFVEDELTITNDKEVIRCDFGPYYLKEASKPKIKDFINTVEAYRCNGSPISKLRSWLNELNNSNQYADNMLKRINAMAKQSSEWDSCIMDKNLKEFDKELSNEKLIIEKDGMKKTPIFDVLQILSVTEAK